MTISRRLHHIYLRCQMQKEHLILSTSYILTKKVLKYFFGRLFLLFSNTNWYFIFYLWQPDLFLYNEVQRVRTKHLWIEKQLHLCAWNMCQKSPFSLKKAYSSSARNWSFWSVVLLGNLLCKIFDWTSLTELVPGNYTSLQHIFWGARSTCAWYLQVVPRWTGEWSGFPKIWNTSVCVIKRVKINQQKWRLQSFLEKYI